MVLNLRGSVSYNCILKFSFPKLEINNGKLNTQIKTTEIAKDLAQVLISHSKAFEILTELKLNFSLTNDCVLTIKNLEEVVEEATAEQETLPETVEEKESVD